MTAGWTDTTDPRGAEGAPGMSYAAFFKAFGGSFRTNHLELGPASRAARTGFASPVRRVRRRAAQALTNAQKDPAASARRFAKRQAGAVAKTVEPPSMNRRPYRLPRSSGLAPDFIRLDPWEGEYLFLLAAGARRGIVETGRLRGGSTFLMACANPRVPITSVDIAPKDDAELQHLMGRHGIGANVELIVGDSQHTTYDEVGDIDLLFVDGDHSYEGCMADLTNWYDKVVPGGHVVVHDCYFGSPPQDATLDFIADREVEVVRTPYIHAVHWQGPTGSLAHVIKRSA